LFVASLGRERTLILMAVGIAMCTAVRAADCLIPGRIFVIVYEDGSESKCIDRSFVLLILSVICFLFSLGPWPWFKSHALRGFATKKSRHLKID